MLVEWRDDLNIGMLEIDIQHKLLFDKFNAFVSAYQSNQDQDEIMRMFWFLEAYAVTHFKEEEKLMQQVRYPDFVGHREKHLAFIDQINRLKERLKVEGITQNMVSTMTGFITSWLIEHISTMDRAIGRFVNNSPLTPLP
ncbi:hemerythrin family protein [Geomonas sp. Red69]|uniref:Hemerythrin family protein n=1 Tax=Geomonas diazotrophica TaxID=2843197 RepID=A0ABX8JGM8_9BACT|nr:MULTISPECIES: hemerythrin family protein [Geomonas]MBU5637767.1 hemerythrin family protein [Geomonas diazotrophica]QWV96301.1 hemerythrin family protein [Geomonas nitrogeniifigens]QXE85368.1 hemerythrin family protein [Geomonas nitrogeniifigens]